MDDGEALFQAAVAAPDDVALRLVYADWLEERGDARAEFIRLQAEMDRLAPYTDAYVELKRRREEIRPRIDAAWITAMGYERRHRPLFTSLPPTRQERWRLAEEFIDVWHGGLRPKDGCTEQEIARAERRLGCRLPAALREWYALAGKRGGIWSHQDHFETLSRLRRDASSDLVIRHENQGCERWRIRAADMDCDDPPVWEVYSGNRVSPTTTAFALLVLVYEAQVSAGVAWLGGSFRPRMSGQRLSRCDLPDHYWVTTPLRIYEGTDLIVQTHGEGWVYVTPRTEEALAQLTPGFRKQLERYR
jgi:uncharacterized protein (TIGR02996 family)